ncbi:MAG TPA: amino acid permease [Gammaproteobacteria bacterium]|nr:amino acid permease [Gammaproteobacteria bacterium]
MPTTSSTSPSLKRALSLPLLTFYGLGTIVGAGIYVLVGAVAEKAGMFTPVSFVLAATIAGFTAFSYAELSSRLPRSAGEALYIQAAFQRPWLASLTGWSVVFIGITSAATIANGYVGYLQVFISLPDWLAIVILVGALGVVAAWGIRESVGLAALITLIEIGGLVYVVLMNTDALLSLPQRWTELVPPVNGLIWSGILLGAFLAFYAFIGFEDMVNVAEEVKDAPRTLPRAIVLALLIASGLYLLIAVVAVLALPVDTLAASDAPLATLLAASGQHHRLLISGISLIAVINGALIQIIMAARVLYGMGSSQLAPVFLARIHPRTRTPLLATVLVSLAVLILALWLPLVALAQLTSLITLAIFTGVNLALIRLKQRIDAPQGSIQIPIWAPWTAALLCLLILIFQITGISA